MMAELAPAWWIFKDEFHRNKQFAQQVRTRAKDRPTIFIDTYQKPSKYWFYSGDTALALNTPTYRRNNFNYWPVEENYIGRPAYIDRLGLIARVLLILKSSDKRDHCHIRKQPC